MSSWNRACVFAPKEEFAKHCEKLNVGKVALKNKKRGIFRFKGRWGCARHCRFFKPKSGLPGRFVMSKAQKEVGE